MATIGEQLAYGYAMAHKVNPSLTKGQYMRRVFRGNRYASDKDAADAFNRVVSGKRSGAELAKAAKVERVTYIRGKKAPLGGATEGLWQIKVHYTAWKDGQPVDQVSTINAESEVYTNFTS